MHARTAVNIFVAFRMNLFHLRNHLSLTLGTSTCRTLWPCIKPTSPHLQHITHKRDRPFFAVLIDELISQFFSFAKKAVVFFKMSRSIRRRRFSLRRRSRLRRLAVLLTPCPQQTLVDPQFTSCLSHLNCPISEFGLRPTRSVTTPHSLRSIDYWHITDLIPSTATHPTPLCPSLPCSARHSL